MAAMEKTAEAPVFTVVKGRNVESLTYSSLGSASRVLWAKSGEPQGHGLLAHLLDVAAVTETLLSVEPVSTRRWAAHGFGMTEADVVRWVAALAGLHDFGKGIPGFQLKWAAGKEAGLAVGLAFPPHACDRSRHDLATAALLGKALHGLTVADPRWLAHVVQAVSAHHGYHFLPAEVSSGAPLAEPPGWREAREEILTAYWRLLAPAGRPNRKRLSLAVLNWLAGLTSAADWIASNVQWFEPGERGFDDLDAYFHDAGKRARKALADIGWQSARPLLAGPEQESADIDDLLTRIVARPGVRARRLQREGDRLLVTASGPSLLLVEAPMGEGKTELAFLAHLRLQAINGHRGLYIALPTQATGNAMFARALTFLQAFAPGALDIQLVHGGAATNDTLQQLRQVHLRGIDENRDEALSASSWFAQRKRPLLSSYGVGTIDQALFAVLNVKHHFVRLWGLANRVVVLDEVHAYDTYTSGLIVALLRWLRELGCSVVLMSATLPRARRAELLAAWGLHDNAVPELDYPRVLLADDQGLRGEHFETRPLAPIQVRGIGESLEAMADEAVALVRDGGCGALIVNTVDRAQRLYGLIHERVGDGVQVQLFHARYPADERAERERLALGTFGQQGERPMVALLIATQVVEQSLDLDFDFMFSDLAPVDLLLQRAGRLHRHLRQRPARHAQAVLHVAGLESGHPPELKDTAWGYVYEPYVLLRTWALLKGEAVLNLPSDIDRLVQAVYQDEPLPPDLEEAVRDRIEVTSLGEHIARVQDERRRSLNITIDPAADPQHAYANRPRGNEEGEGTGLVNRTRIGPDSITVIPVEVAPDGWHLHAGSPPFSSDQPVSDALARALYARQIKVTKFAAVKRFKGGELPLAFQHPLLRHCYPLPLQGGRFSEPGLGLRLDPELGLVWDAPS